MEKPYLSNTNGNIEAASDVGTVLDKYELVDVLGRGGMGVVFKAKHIALPRFFAIKVLNRQLSNDIDFRARFEKEAHTASRLDHPHLVSITDYGATEAGEAYLVMDFIDGQSLDEALKKVQRIDQRRAVKIFAQVCEGLSYAHDLGVIHRDLKPSNIMLVKTKVATDFARVVDFGIAKMVSADGDITQSLTKTGQILGSPLYMSPEQSTADKLTHSTDIYSMGVLMYECLTGAPPFRGENAFATIMMHSEAAPKPFDENLAIEGKLEAIVMNALEKNPVDRFQSMEELRLALLDLFDNGQKLTGGEGKKSVGADGPEHAGLGGHGKRNRSSTTRILVGLALLLAGGCCASYYVVTHNNNWLAPVNTGSAQEASNSKSRANETKQSREMTQPMQMNEDDLPHNLDLIQLPVGYKNLSALELVQEGGKTEKRDDDLRGRYCMEAAKRDPQSHDAWDKLSEYYWARRENARSDVDAWAALNDCRKVASAEIKHRPDYPDGYFTRNNVDVQLGDVEANLRHPDAYASHYKDALNDSDAYIKLNEASIEKLLKLPPSPGIEKSLKHDYDMDVKMHLSHAAALKALKRYPEAIAETEKYIVKQDAYKDFYNVYNYREIFRVAGKVEESIDAISRLIKKVGKTPALLCGRAYSEWELHRFKEALSDYEAAGKMDPDVFQTKKTDIEDCKKNIKAQAGTQDHPLAGKRDRSKSKFNQIRKNMDGWTKTLEH